MATQTDTPRACCVGEVGYSGPHFLRFSAAGSTTVRSYSRDLLDTVPAQFSGHSAPITHIADGGAMVVSCDAAGTVACWNPKTCRPFWSRQVNTLGKPLLGAWIIAGEVVVTLCGRYTHAGTTSAPDMPDAQAAPLEQHHAEGCGLEFWHVWTGDPVPSPLHKRTRDAFPSSRHGRIVCALQVPASIRPARLRQLNVKPSTPLTGGLFIVAFASCHVEVWHCVRSCAWELVACGNAMEDACLCRPQRSHVDTAANWSAAQDGDGGSMGTNALEATEPKYVAPIPADLKTEPRQLSLQDGLLLVVHQSGYVAQQSFGGIMA